MPRRRSAPRQTTNETDRAFHLSRIYAKGWSAAKSISSDVHLDLDAPKIAAMNPYKQDDERQRWAEGFAAGALR